MKVTTDQEVSRILRNLGNEVVDIELDSSTVEGIISDSLLDVSPYILESKYITVPTSPIIDLSEYDIEYVQDVFKSTAPVTNKVNINDDDNAVLFGGSAAGQMLWQTGGLVSSNGYDIGELAVTQALLRTQLNAIKGSVSDTMYQYDNGKLYVNKGVNTPYLTIEAIIAPKVIEDISDPYWIQQVHNMAMANAKITIGRIRSKYTINSNKYTLDGAGILAEGIQERQNILDDWKASSLQLLQLDD